MIERRILALLNRTTKSARIFYLRRKWKPISEIQVHRNKLPEDINKQKQLAQREHK